VERTRQGNEKGDKHLRPLSVCVLGLCVRAYVYMCVYVCQRKVCVRVYTRACVYTHAHIYIYIYIYIYI